LGVNKYISEEDKAIYIEALEKVGESLGGHPELKSGADE
jgi:hypothetical protein